MHGYMNVEALKKTIESKEAHYFSRSRKTIWHKGKTSGFTQKVTEIRIDDDQDSILLIVDIGNGSSCHVGYRSCLNFSWIRLTFVNFLRIKFFFIF